MTYSMKSEKNLDGGSKFREWKTRIDLILAKNKVLDIMKGKIVKPVFEEGKEKEPQNVAVMEKFKDGDINAMSIIVDSIKDHSIPYISHLDSSKKMYDALTNIFSVRNIGQVYDPLKIMKYISMVAAMKYSVCSVQPQKKSSSKRSLKVSPVFHPHP
jgi:hypothetical protein